MSKVNSPEYMELHSCFHQTLINEIILCQISEPKIKESLRTRVWRFEWLTMSQRSVLHRSNATKHPMTPSNNSHALTEPAGGTPPFNGLLPPRSAAANGRSSQETTVSFPRTAAWDSFKTDIFPPLPPRLKERYCPTVDGWNKPTATTKKQTETTFHSQFFLRDSKSVTLIF